MSVSEHLFNDKNKAYGYFIPKGIIKFGEKNTISIRTYSTYEYGPLRPITIEEAAVVQKKIYIYDLTYTNMYFANCIILSFLSFYFYFLYSKMREKLKYMYFSMLCFTTAVYCSKYFISLVPFSYLTYQKIVISAMFLIPAFFLLYFKQLLNLKLLKTEMIYHISRIIIILLSVLIIKDLIDYYFFRKYFIILLFIDIIYFIYLAIVELIKKNEVMRQLSFWLVLVAIMCMHDIFYTVIGKVSSLGLDLNLYGLMLFLCMNALKLANEYITVYKKVSKDGLTSLYTQSYFKNELLELMKSKSNLKYPISIMMLDIDYFKKFNDTYGHLMGDEVLKAVSSIIQDSLPENSVVARYGGEEFAVILKNCDEEKAKNIAEQIRKNIEMYKFKQTEIMNINVTISIGITTYHADKINLHPEDLIQEADEALYYSKNHGRNKATHHKEFRYVT